MLEKRSKKLVSQDWEGGVVSDQQQMGCMLPKVLSNSKQPGSRMVTGGLCASTHTNSLTKTQLGNNAVNHKSQRMQSAKVGSFGQVKRAFQDEAIAVAEKTNRIQKTQYSM